MPDSTTPDIPASVDHNNPLRGDGLTLTEIKRRDLAWFEFECHLNGYTM